MAFSPDPSPRRRDRSPAKSISPAKAHLGLSSLSRAAGTFTNPPMLPPGPPMLSPEPPSNIRADYFNSQYRGPAMTATSASAFSHIMPSRASPSINPGAKNSFASPLTDPMMDTAAVNNVGRGTPLSMGGRRKSSLQSTRTNATHGTVASASTESSRLSQTPLSPENERRHKKKRGPSQKDMLSKALQRANDAVLMDNDSDLQGAIEAYQEACSLLKKVMMRSSVSEDRRKLDSIRGTYKDRIAELRGSMEYSGDEFDELTELNDVHDGYLQDDRAEQYSDNHDDLYDADIVEDDLTMSHHHPATTAPPIPPPMFQPRSQSLNQGMPTSDREHSPTATRNAWNQADRAAAANAPLTLPRIPAADEDVIPAPLSPWRTRSPANAEPPKEHAPQPSNLVNSSRADKGHVRQDTAESTSWLDTIDESGDSTSSVHSRSSSVHEKGARRYLVRRSGNTVADFDAALDSAIEAAYDDSFETLTDADLLVYEDGRLEGIGQRPIPAAIEGQYPSDIRRKVKAARERVRQAEREDTYVKSKIELRSGRATPAGRMTPAGRQTPAPDVNELYEEEEIHEEDVILKEMQEFADDAPSMAPGHVPHDSDTNSSRNAWTNSGGSTEASATTNSSAPDIPKGVPSLPGMESFSARPPSLTLPSIPGLSSKKPSPVIPPPLSTPSSLASFAPAIVSPGVRERRLSGRKIGSLTIDTGAKPDPSQQAPKTVAVSHGRLSPIRQLEIDDGPKSAIETETNSFAAQLESAKIALAAPSQFNMDGGSEAASGSPRTSLFARTPLSETKSAQHSVPASPARSRPGTASGLRKNFSSSSLKSLKNMVATPTTVDDSPQTPMMRVFSGSSQPGHGSVPSVPELPTPAAATFLRHGLGPGSLSFFNVDIHSLASPGSPNPAIPNGPAPLEPCPESSFLRPFWMLRCVYQIIANPHGGYLSQKLFVPRDVWRVRNVKIRNVDEKVAQCDLLTAALLKLARSDMEDADAVLEEMQALEIILDQVQATLQKRLGVEVGLQGAQQLFKSTSAKDDGEGANNAGSTTSRISSGWRRLGLRNKGSSGAAQPAGSGAFGLGRDTRDTLKLNSLPMATGAIVPKKHIRRDPTQVLGIGPHANYMAALARLSDAAQILDQVARQVEDPGLRQSSQTHVGLELCVRHASEFFAFFICRFAMNDIASMLDKFVKRGGEWIMS